MDRLTSDLRSAVWALLDTDDRNARARLVCKSARAEVENGSRSIRSIRGVESRECCKQDISRILGRCESLTSLDVVLLHPMELPHLADALDGMTPERLGRMAVAVECSLRSFYVDDGGEDFGSDAVRVMCALRRLDLKVERGWSKQTLTAAQIAEIARLTSLHTLDISQCEVDDALPALAALTGLRCLRLRRWWTDINRVGNVVVDDLLMTSLVRLTELHIYEPNLADYVNVVGHMTSLAALRVDRLRCGHGLTSLPELTALTGLTRLSLSLESPILLNPMATAGALMAGLVELALPGDCLDRLDADALRKLTALRRIDLSRNRRLESVDALGACAALEEVDLSDCAKLASVAPLAALPRLVRVKVSGCRPCVVDSCWTLGRQKT